MKMNRSAGSSLEIAEAALVEMIESLSAEGGDSDPWTHELTPVVKNCTVASTKRNPVLQVNPVWLRELFASSDLQVLADEMRTWSAIQAEVARCKGLDLAQRGPNLAA